MNLHMPLHTEENMLDMNWLQPAKELVKHNIQYIVFQKLKYFWVAKPCYTKSIQYPSRLMTTFIGRVNRTIYELLIFRTDKLVAPSESETSEYPATLFTCVGALWTTRCTAVYTKVIVPKKSKSMQQCQLALCMGSQRAWFWLIEVVVGDSATRNKKKQMHVFALFLSTTLKHVVVHSSNCKNYHYP